MTLAITPFEASPGELPDRFPSPFDALGPHAIARRAVLLLQAEFATGLVAPGVPAAALDAPEAGKMFGVLVVQLADGRLGWTRAFSGQLAGRWDHAGFVPPIFDRAAREAVEEPGEATVKELTRRVESWRTGEPLAQARTEALRCVVRHEEERAALKLRHEENRRERHGKRSGALSPEEVHALEQQSRGDKAERRRLDARHASERAEVERTHTLAERRLAALERLRRFVCRRLMRSIHGTYVLTNGRGVRTTVRALFASGEPPSGAGDCAGAKLLAHAIAHDLRPIALAEFWWGAPPATGARVSGGFHAACAEKCGPILPFLLAGLDVAPPRRFTPPVLDGDGLEIVYEDAWLVVVNKPCGLLSVPSRDAAVTDSVLARLRARHPHATGPLLVHRLDLDTSGLLVAALDAQTHAAIQRQFEAHTIRKRYVAWLDVEVAGDRGFIDLALRVDVDDRPRQIHDPIHGKPAQTAWEVLERSGARTRVALFPHTGRTHQLRVHASHPRGLGAAITGDRLYGREAERLLLHAEWIEFTHPGTGARVAFERPAPF